jgi:hypothetical protein
VGLDQVGEMDESSAGEAVGIGHDKVVGRGG